MSLLPVADAQARLLAMAPRLTVETAPLAECIGRWLAEDVIALRDQPWSDLSAMDGYAMRHADGPGPWRVTGESAAGSGAPPPLAAGEAARIFTGAPLPAGSDCVLLQENAVRTGDLLQMAEGGARLTPGLHVRPRGSDFRLDDRLLSHGARIGPAGIALAALGGHGSLTVRRRPRIVLISTGSELVPPGATVAPGQLPSSNAVMLRAMLAEIPCEIEDMGVVGDSLDALTAAFSRASHADLVVSTGGASVGDHDLVRPALLAAGGAIDFWKVAMRPGKPLIAGRLGEAMMLGLPGNPVSAFVTALLFLLPLARQLSGARAPLPEMRTAILARPLAAGGGRDHYLRAICDSGQVDPLEDQDSAGTRALAQANCLVLQPSQAPARNTGDSVTILPVPGTR